MRTPEALHAMSDYLDRDPHAPAGADATAALGAWIAESDEHALLFARLTMVDQMLESEAAGRRRLALETITNNAGDTAGAAMRPDAEVVRPVAPADRRFVLSRRFAPVAIAAALALLVGVSALVYFATTRGGGAPAGAVAADPEAPMAVITGSRSARWITEPQPEGQTLGRTGMALESGAIELEFLNGTSTVVTGPAEVAITGPQSCRLQRGRIDVDVRGGGFRVETPRFTVTDLGTRFTVVLDGAEAWVEVVEGVVLLDPRDPADPLDRIAILAGQTAVIPPAESDDPAVRVFRRLDLARVVGGPNGNDGIDLRTGLRGPERAQYIHGHANRFVAADDPYIDGVVVPDGGPGGTTPVPITSTGLTITGLPDTSGTGYDHLWAGPAYVRAESLVAEVDYTAEGHTQLGMHPNKAVTFDLDALRRDHPDARALRFTATVAVAPNASGRVDVLIAVDADVRFRAMGLNASSAPVPVDLALPEGARFLTLITTDGGNDISADWPVIGDPIVTFEVDPAAPEEERTGPQPPETPVHPDQAVPTDAPAARPAQP